MGASFSIGDNGKFTSLKCASDLGGTTVQGAIGPIQELKQDPAAEAKAQSDLIYQKQRLLICESDADACSV